MKSYLSSILCLFLLFIPVTTAYADKHPDHAVKKECKDAERQQHLVEVMQLNHNDAKRFAALYAQYSREMRDARKKYARIRTKKVDGKPVRLTEDQIRQNLELQFSLAQAILDIRQKYHQEYVKFLAPSKIEQLYNLEKKGAEKLREMAEKRKKAPHKSGGKPAKPRKD